MKFRRITGLTFRCGGAKQSFRQRIKVLTVLSDSRLTKIARAVRSLIAAARSAFCVEFLLLLQRAVQTRVQTTCWCSCTTYMVCRPAFEASRMLSVV